MFIARSIPSIRNGASLEIAVLHFVADTFRSVTVRVLRAPKGCY